MKTIARMALKPGMVLADDVLSYKNELLFPKDTVITDAVIAKLQRDSIMCVDIKDAQDLATTHFEKVRASDNFKRFVKVYKTCLEQYKDIINDMVINKKSPDLKGLINIFAVLTSVCKTGETLLDYLYNMVPSEDDLTYSHCLNSALIAGVFGTWLSLNKDDLTTLIYCAYFYDIGKLLLPNELIWKPDRLSDQEFEKVKTHTINGFRLLQDYNLDDNIYKATLQHHERCDGKGYPSKLHENQINIFAKYISVIDAYEAMTSARIYRKAMIPLQAIANFEDTMNRYSPEILKPILLHIANSQLGMTVRLSDDTLASVILINPGYLSRPLLKSGDQIIDLSKRHDLSIVAML